ncbi:hypothetical protein H9Q69_014273 [Fusarium xylarioides]|uniref:DUF7918 domain-containing protein n=1 Tax=Fusarium xylarioides TaxID=221167 RepID=A0A9P7HPD5_9HYPO|nr:hypothetical protein H9Q70_005827 [Fusarium xylarioides]KAG5764008.1 hypothetical protein H9Q72_007916 [Fusarium xylarioides]KAG5780332.1 hypothetical protein H9Q73_006005 [Fusarium xylarioides]KAG5786649.1 hypothetical protein H9Q69_014273 [Fusarium xylarioides]KAG5809125.1 hypothetical protein H9Q71_006454 [Fusarium xylarioides]
MAVLDEVPLVTARVRVAGELATEYDPLGDQEPVINLDKEGNKINTRNCYIESKSGAEFAVEVTVSDKYRLPHSHDRFIAEVSIDGQWMESSCIMIPFPPGMPYTIVISSCDFSTENERVVVRKFVFAPITKTSDHISTDRLNNDIKQAETLGTIRLRLITGRFIGPHLKKPLIWHGGRDVELAEKALKESLQHEMIIPRTPSPRLSGLDEDSLSHLSENDIRRLAMERLRDTQVKDEFSQVKREAEENPRTPRSWKFVKLDNGREAVDLTDD